MHRYLIILAGPTAVGKTSVSLHIARHFDIPVISSDSRQVYKEMMIGTARPSEEEMQGIKHYFIGNLSIKDHYNAGRYEEDVLKLLEEVYQNSEYALLAGGSGLYINAVCNGIDQFPSADLSLRKELTEVFENEGLESIRSMLKKLDPVHYDRVDLKNPKRILKALEVSIAAGKPYSSFLTKPEKKRNFTPVWIGLNREREELYERINQRVDQMMEAGLPDEAKRLYPYRDENALNTVGYKELFDYFDGETDLEEAVRLIKRNSRHYARRQLIWFNKNEKIKWFHPDEIDSIIAYVEKATAKK
ncbi:MAG TPA: tRNA (adenosine(37)-N6)-dimethylallyltransferase MiaA [Bacteroidales bacterium]|nr:tRNA (adenosine(37)-N6)-dimethylallyltransferase MiaA [Bacteroidales bacterium]